MTKEVEEELDAILARHNARVAEARTEAAGKTAAQDTFTRGATSCLENVIAPALQQMAEALKARGVAARLAIEASTVRLDIPVSRHARLGYGLGGYPYLRARVDRQTRRIHFERNTVDGRGGSRVADYAIAEVSSDLVKAMVMDLVRALFGAP